MRAARVRYNVRKLKNLALGLKEAEPAFRNITVNGRPILENGRPYSNFGDIRPRELAANWLIAAVLNYCCSSGDRFQLMTDPGDADGLIFDAVTEQALWTEHVIVIDRTPSRTAAGDTQAHILKQVSQKNNRGDLYGRGRHLIVFLYRSGNPGPWWPNRVARGLPRPLNFHTVWVVCFQHFEANDRIYAVTCLDLSHGHAPMWLVRIDASFNRWAVAGIQPAQGPTDSPWAYNNGFLAPSRHAPLVVLPPRGIIRAPSAIQLAYFSLHTAAPSGMSLQPTRELRHPGALVVRLVGN